MGNNYIFYFSLAMGFVLGTGSLNLTEAQLIFNPTDYLTYGMDFTNVEQEYQGILSPDNNLTGKNPQTKLEECIYLSTNTDMTYRSSRFYKSDYNGIILQGDSRLELWLPPLHKEFAWGPYVRFAGITSTRSYDWENAFLAKPGFGFHVYPFSLRQFNEKHPLWGQNLSPFRLFGELNRWDYPGPTNAWDQNEQIRLGADYWRASYINDVTRPWWTEIRTSLIWQSANEFFDDYEAWVFDGSLRGGIRKPDAGILSQFSPYLLLESTVTDKKIDYWDNRLVGGVGIRFTPFIGQERKKPSWLTRLVIFAEYQKVISYYRDSAPSSSPDYDFHIGISFNIGEWYKDTCPFRN